MNEISAEYIKAKELDRRIKTSAQLAQQSLYDMCMGFKEMRDSKLYKELGYQNFEDYCEKEAGFSREQGRKYIKIAESFGDENANSSWHLGATKLYLLSKLSDEERTEITENNDLEQTSVRELEEQIKALKNDKEILQNDKDRLRNEAYTQSQKASDLADENEELTKKIRKLEAEIKELESRPIEIKTPEPAENEKKLNEVIKSLERENIRQNEALEESYRKQTDSLRAQLEQEKQEALSALKKELADTKAEYEKKLAEKPQTSDEDKTKSTFKVYLAAAFDALKRVTSYAKECNDRTFNEKIRQLLQAVEKEIE